MEIFGLNLYFDGTRAYTAVARSFAAFGGSYAPDLTEMKRELQVRGTDVDESTICRFLKESKFSRKKMRLVAIQQSEELKQYPFKIWNFFSRFCKILHLN